MVVYAAMRRQGLVLTLVLALCGTACDDDATSSGDGGGGGSAGAGGSPGTGGNGGGSAGMGGGDFVPTPADVLFTPVAAVPAGEQILFNDWSLPDRVLSMAPDGSGASEIFRIHRVWSMGVSRAGDKLALACGDPEQEAHYGITIGDAIQHTWLYDFGSQTLELLAHGNINDECHHFGPGDGDIYLCRRYDFTPEGTFGGYRIGVLHLSDLSFDFLVPEEPNVFTLNPQVNGSDLYFGHLLISGGSQTRSIRHMTLPNGTPTVLRPDAYRPLLSPSGTRYLFADPTQGSALYASDLDGSNTVLVVDRAGTSASYSPDGSQIAYLLWDDTASCSHVEVVASDGSQSDAPVRIRDCAQSGEFITELDWFERQP